MSREPALPPGWPAEVRPPWAPDWLRSATAWMFDCCPPDFRAYDVLRRHPRVLGRFAAASLDGALTAADAALSTIRSDLSDLPAETVEAAVSALDRERDRLRGTRRAVDVVERAMRGETWTPRL